MLGFEEVFRCGEIAALGKLLDVNPDDLLHHGPFL
jgi:hypothetical protein